VNTDLVKTSLIHLIPSSLNLRTSEALGITRAVARIPGEETHAVVLKEELLTS
jgi:hypothetical protein